MVGSFWEKGFINGDQTQKKQLMKNRNINPKTTGQSVADFIISPIARHHFTMLMLVQVCLALSMAVPATVNGFEPLSDNLTAESDAAFSAEGRWTPTGSLNSARAIHTATLLPNGLVLVAGGLNTRSVESQSAELLRSGDPNVGGDWQPQRRALLLPGDVAV